MTVTRTDSTPRDAATHKPTWLHRLARLVRRFPLSGVLIQRAYRLIVPRYSLGVVGVLLDRPRERVLLVEHVFHPVKPWGLPGGWLDRGEDPARGIEREFREETGLRVRAICPVLVERVPAMHGHMDIVYLCVLDGDGQRVQLSHELLDHRWARLDALPPLFDAQQRAIALAARITCNNHHPGGGSWTTDA